jgi:uncharacterized protein YbjT (DUF2867 family)
MNKSRPRREPRAAAQNAPAILLTGATGYVGGRLLTALESAGHRVRCLVRRPGKFASRIGPANQLVQGDVLDRPALARAMRGMQVAYYLIHSMESEGSFEEKDRLAAGSFAEAARKAGVRRIIYLGGLGQSGTELSAHLRSRHEVGEILRGSGVQVIEFRASIIIGSGSLSFEMVRALVDRLPVMVTPRWVSNPTQPIAIADVVRYLVGALDAPVAGNQVFEIGGADVVSYADIMREYARQSGKPCILIHVPVLTPWLSSLWLGLVTPLQARVGRHLIESIEHPTVVSDNAARRIFRFRPMGMRKAIASVLQSEDAEFTAA